MMNRTDVINQYAMEDLIPIVEKLANELTANESSSITYEKARQLMEAVIYCIAHLETGSRSLITQNPLSASEAYELGFAAVIEEVKAAQHQYNQLMEFFDSYDNRNYRDTVEKALPGFFMYYDAKFAPMENIITMDYPILGMDMQLEGIDRIRQYIDGIWAEQCYLRQFARGDIIHALRSFHLHYEQEFFNLREIVEMQQKKEVDNAFES